MYALQSYAGKKSGNMNQSKRLIDLLNEEEKDCCKSAAGLMRRAFAVTSVLPLLLSVTYIKT